MRGDMLTIGSALRNRAAHRFQTRSCHMESVGGVVGLLVVALLMDALRNDVVMFIGRVIHLLASVWGMGMLAVVCTLGTHCTEGVSVACVQISQVEP